MREDERNKNDNKQTIWRHVKGMFYGGSRFKDEFK